MAQTAIISPQIIDSTSIGRDLITAADQAAAQAIIGVTGIDTGEDYTWTGDNTFEGTLTADYIEWSNVNGIHNQPNINGFHFFAFGGSNVFRASALDFIPMSDGTKALGRSDLRFSDVFAVDGEFSGTVNANYIYDASIIQFDAGSLMYFRIGGDAKFLMNSNAFYPNNSTDLGLVTKRFGNIYSANGSFSSNLINEVGGSYKLYSLGTEGDADTEFIELFQDGGTSRIQTNATGTGTASPIVFRSGTNGGYMLANASQFQIGAGGVATLVGTAFNVTLNKSLLMGSASVNIGSTSGNRVLGVNAVNGDFSGTVKANAFDIDSGQQYFHHVGSLRMGVGGAGVFFYSNQIPNSTTYTSGTSTKRWGCVYSQDGSFSENLISEVGGSFKLYNFGAEGDADTEYGEISWDANVFKIDSKVTGSATGRTLRLGAGTSYLNFNYNGTWQMYRNGSLMMSFGSANISVYRYFQPNSDLGVAFGSATRRWSTGHFGDVQASTMTLSNLPTSDPAVEGQLWNDSGTVKISAG